MTRHPAVGWLILGASVVVGAASWFVVWGTWHPGFGFESMTVPAAIVGLFAGLTFIAGVVVLQGRRRPVGALAVVLGLALLALAVHLGSDIPGSPGDYPRRSYDASGLGEVYRSRLRALWVTGLAALSLLTYGVGTIARRRRVRT